MADEDPYVPADRGAGDLRGLPTTGSGAVPALTAAAGVAPPWMRVPFGPVQPRSARPAASPALATVTSLAGRLRPRASRGDVPAASRAQSSRAQSARIEAPPPPGARPGPGTPAVPAAPRPAVRPPSPAGHGGSPVGRVIGTGRDLPARPTIRPDPGILGLSRLTRGTFGSKVFTWVFIGIYALIFIDMVWSLVKGY